MKMESFNTQQEDGMEDLNINKEVTNEDLEKKKFLDHKLQEAGIEKKDFKIIGCLKNWLNTGLKISFITFTLSSPPYIAYSFGKVAFDTLEYSNYLKKDTLDSVDKKESKRLLEEKIKNILGKRAVLDIKQGDEKAYFRKKRPQLEVKIPKIDTVKDLGLQRKFKYQLTEKYGMHPNGWISGQIDEILVEERSSVILDVLLSFYRKSKTEAVGKAAGQFTPENAPFNKRIMTIYTDPFNEIKEDEYFMRKELGSTIEHELGHANDWVNSLNLSIEDRYRMLLEVHERMISKDHFTKDGYIESYNDGTPEGKYRATVEYWAEICAEFFENEGDFFKEHPKDFELVNKYVKMKDPNFNILSKTRGAFNRRTGELRPEYSEEK